MPRCLGKLLVALSLGLASPVLAQDAAAPDNRIMLELNGAAEQMAEAGAEEDEIAASIREGLAKARARDGAAGDAPANA